MKQTKYHIPILYNPSTLTKSELIDNFVIRTKEFEQIFHILEDDNMEKPPQHIIIEGQRGSGKTTLLLRLYYEIIDSRTLNPWLIPMMFDEEQYGIRTLSRLWEKVGEYLEDCCESFSGITDEFEKVIENDRCEEECFELLTKYLRKVEKKMVLFIDNFGDMVKKFKEKETQRLREILMTSSDIRIIAGSSTVLEFTHDYSKPFYEFFKVVHLKGLKKSETIELLLKLGESYKADEIKSIIKNEPARVEALRRLTSGVPRTIVLLFEIFVDNENGNAFRDLEMTLDGVTPLYKHRMDDLPAQQQEIVEVIALNWDAISVKEIVQKTRMESKAVSAQLKELVKNKIIEKEPTSTKNHLYRVYERFFNIWYLMRYGGRKHKNKVKFLVKFLELWCTPKDLAERTYKHIEAIHSGKVYESHALYFSEALAQTSLPAKIQDELIKETRIYLKSRKSELADELSHSDYEVFEEIIELLKKENEELALKKAEELRDKKSEALLLLGFLYQVSLKDFLKAVECFEKAANKGDSEGWVSLALLHGNEYKDYKKAEEYYLKAVEAGHSGAMNNLALLYQREYKDYKKAEEYYLKAVEAGHSGAMNNLALLYEQEYKDYKKAEEYYLKGIQNSDYGSMNGLAWILFENNERKEEALQYAGNSVELKQEFFNLHTLATILLWNDNLESAIEIWQKELFKEEFIEKYADNITDFLLFLIAKKQYNYLYKLFEKNQFDIKERYKPVYYALLYFMGEKYSDELKKMGPELKETVDEIIERVKELRDKYD